MDPVTLDQLCRDACVALGLDNPDALRDEGMAEIDGIEMALRFDPEDDPNGLSFYVDLGLPAVEHRAQVCEELLKINLLHGTSTCAVYAVDGESGHAVSCLRFDDIEEVDSEFLAQMLRFGRSGHRESKAQGGNAAGNGSDRSLSIQLPREAEFVDVC